MRTKPSPNLLAIVLAIAAAAYSRNSINGIAATFIEDRVAQATFFCQLVRENRDGIKPVPDDKKTLLRNLDPSSAETDLRTMRELTLIFFFSAIVLFVFGRVGA